jgi:putative RNA 2'-phosphotransferase
MVTENNLVRVSKFLSYVLRHRPDTIGITLDREGWANITHLIAGAAKSGKHLDREIIQVVVGNNDKKRFAISEDGQRIRAVQGHSLGDVVIGYVDKVPPEFLYHGTATRFSASIRERGLIARGRQYVHLSRPESCCHSWETSRDPCSAWRNHGRACTIGLSERTGAYIAAR